MTKMNTELKNKWIKAIQHINLSKTQLNAIKLLMHLVNVKKISTEFFLKTGLDLDKAMKVHFIFDREILIDYINKEV